MAEDTLIEPPCRNRAPTVAKWGAIVIGGLVLLVAALLIGLNTGPGKRFVADQIGALEFENGMGIDVGRIEGSLYGEMILHDVSLSDPKGTFLTSPEMRMDWRPFAFINSHIDIRSLTSRLVTLQRLPEFNETPPSEDPLLPDYDIDIGTLRIDSFVAEAPVSGERRVASLAGEAHIADGRAQARFDAVTIAGQGRAGGDRIALLLDALPEENKLDLDLDLNAPGDGVLAAMAGLTEPVRIRLNGNGSWDAWNGRLDANLAGSEFARLKLSAREGTFAVRGPTRIARMFEGPTAALLGPVMNIDMTATLDERRATLAGNLGSDAFRLNTNGLDLTLNKLEESQLGKLVNTMNIVFH